MSAADETSKLTASYGIFSCSLEGAENPLELMKDIASFFQQMSAEDRNFGATPTMPAPRTFELDRPVRTLADAALAA